MEAGSTRRASGLKLMYGAAVILALCGGFAVGKAREITVRTAVMDYGRSQCEFRNTVDQVAGQPQLQMPCDELFPRGAAPTPQDYTGRGDYAPRPKQPSSAVEGGS